MKEQEGVYCLKLILWATRAPSLKHAIIFKKEVCIMEELLIQILEGQNEIKKDIKEIKTTVQRIEISQPQDITALLERMNINLENKMEVLNKRVFNVETEIERLNRQ
jgi:hypothetical protein